jgi:hypothetical protein
MPLGAGVSPPRTYLLVLKTSAYQNKGFYINLPAGGVVVAALFLIQIPRPKHQVRLPSNVWDALKTLDIIGFVLFAPSAIMFLLALEWGGNAYRWGSATVIGLFCGAAGTFAVFLIWEYNVGDTAMVPFGMIKRRIIYCSCFTMAFLAANINMTSYYLAIYFQAIRGATPMLAGVYTLPSILSQMFVAVTAGIMGKYRDKYDEIPSLTVASWPRWLLHAVRNSGFCYHSYWLWLVELPYSFLINGEMDRISNY